MGERRDEGEEEKSGIEGGIRERMRNWGKEGCGRKKGTRYEGEKM